MLTPEEQAELEALKREEELDFGLTPEEEQELAMLKEEERLDPEIDTLEIGFFRT